MPDIWESMMDGIDDTFGREMTLRRRIPGELDPEQMVRGMDAFVDRVIKGRRWNERVGQMGSDRVERLIEFAISRQQQNPLATGPKETVDIAPGDQLKDGNEWYLVSSVRVEVGGLDLVVSASAAKPGSQRERAGT